MDFDFLGPQVFKDFIGSFRPKKVGNPDVNLGISEFYGVLQGSNFFLEIKTLNRLNHLWVGSLWHVFSLP